MLRRIVQRGKLSLVLEGFNQEKGRNKERCVFLQFNRKWTMTSWWKQSCKVSHSQSFFFFTFDTSPILKITCFCLFMNALVAQCFIVMTELWTENKFYTSVKQTEQVQEINCRGMEKMRGQDTVKPTINDITLKTLDSAWSYF